MMKSTRATSLRDDLAANVVAFEDVFADGRRAFEPRRRRFSSRRRRIADHRGSRRPRASRGGVPPPPRATASAKANATAKAPACRLRVLDDGRLSSRRSRALRARARRGPRRERERARISRGAMASRSFPSSSFRPPPRPFAADSGWRGERFKPTRPRAGGVVALAVVPPVEGFLADWARARASRCPRFRALRAEGVIARAGEEDHAVPLVVALAKSASARAVPRYAPAGAPRGGEGLGDGRRAEFAATEAPDDFVLVVAVAGHRLPHHAPTRSRGRPPRSARVSPLDP